METSYDAVSLTIQEDGNLSIAIVNRESFDEIYENRQSENAQLADLLEQSNYTGNDWYNGIVLGLTEIPNICQGIIYATEDELEIEATDEINGYLKGQFDFENIWGYQNYMMTSFMDELAENGKVVFTNLF